MTPSPYYPSTFEYLKDKLESVEREIWAINLVSQCTSPYGALVYRHRIFDLERDVISLASKLDLNKDSVENFFSQ